MSEPREIVENFIHQVCCLFGQHAALLEELNTLSNDESVSADVRETYDTQYWCAVQNYRTEHKKLCRQFGFKITEHNFSEMSYQSPIVYDKHEIVNIENLSVTKVKVITKHCINKKKYPLVFYLEVKNEQWCIVKLRQIESDNKEASVWCW